MKTWSRKPIFYMSIKPCSRPSTDKEMQEIQHLSKPSRKKTAWRFFTFSMSKDNESRKKQAKQTKDNTCNINSDLNPSMEQYDDKNCYWSFPQGIYKF